MSLSDPSHVGRARRFGLPALARVLRTLSTKPYAERLNVVWSHCVCILTDEPDRGSGTPDRPGLLAIEFDIERDRFRIYSAISAGGPWGWSKSGDEVTVQGETRECDEIAVAAVVDEVVRRDCSERVSASA